MTRRMTFEIRITYVYFSIKLTSYTFQYNVLYLNEKLFKFKIVSSPLCSFCNLEMKSLYSFFTLAIKQNLFGLNYKSYWTQKYFFYKIRHRVHSLIFQIIKVILKSLTICILDLSIICFRKIRLEGLMENIIKIYIIEKQIYFNDSKKGTMFFKKWHIIENLLRWRSILQKVLGRGVVK